MKKQAAAKIKIEGKEFLETEEGQKLKEELAAEFTKQVNLELAKSVDESPSSFVNANTGHL
jgi:hypothetical protein